jgi:hypothetical protein
MEEILKNWYKPDFRSNRTITVIIVHTVTLEAKAVESQPAKKKTKKGKKVS